MPQMRAKVFGAVLSLLVAAALIAPAANTRAAGAQDPPLTAVGLRLNWQMKGEFAPFIVAIKNGFFRKQGLEVSLREGSSGTQALQSLASGRDDFAYVPSVQLIEAVNHGVPVKATATVVKVDSMAMVSIDSALKSPKELEGRTVEIAATSTFSQIWSAFARKNHIDIAKVQVVRVNPAARFNLLLSGKVDILADIFMTNEFPILASKAGNKELHTLIVGNWGFHLIGYTLAATTATIADKPDLIRRFNAGALEGFRFTMAHPEEAAAIASAAYPNLLPANTTVGQVKELVAFLHRGQPAAPFLGSDADWTSTLDILKASGVIPQEKPVGDYYTNAFVPK
jgi:NitT/TauT family transport system substrate-binding protein